MNVLTDAELYTLLPQLFEETPRELISTPTSLHALYTQSMQAVRPDNVAQFEQEQFAPAAPQPAAPPAARAPPPPPPGHYREWVDTYKLLTIRDNFPQVWERLGRVFRVPVPGRADYEEATYDQAFAIINRLCAVKAKGYSDVAYKQHGQLKTGRRFSEGMSLQGLHRQIRHAIAATLYHDSDIENAHPTFALQIAREHGVAHPLLDTYVNNRDACIQRWIGTTVPSVDGPKVLDNRGAVKGYVLKLLYGGGSANTSNPELNAFHAATRQLLDRVYVAKEYRNFRRQADKVQPRKEYENPKGTCLSYVLCDIEDKALRIIETCAAEAGARVGALCFDGLMIEQAATPAARVPGLVAEMSRRVSEELGYPVRVSHKAMDEAVDLTGLEPNPEAPAAVPLLTGADAQRAQTDVMVAQKYYELLVERGIKYNPVGGLYLYDPAQALWLSRDLKLLREGLHETLEPWVAASFEPSEAEKFRNRVLLNSGARSAILTEVNTLVTSRTDQLSFDSAEGRFPIAGGLVVDFRSGAVETRPRTKLDYFTRASPHSYKPLAEADPARAQFVRDYHTDILSTIVENELGEEEVVRATDEHRDCFITTFGRVLAGENPEKQFVNFIGKRDGGKSLFLEMYGKVLGGFACTANSRVFLARKGDALCHDSELFTLRGKRMASLSETEEGAALNEQLIKAISGRDPISMRAAGEKEVTEVTLNSALVLVTNNVFRMSDEAFKTRLLCFNAGNRFEKSAQAAERILDHLPEFFSLYCEYAARYYAAGRKVPLSAEVKAYTNRVIHDQDPVNNWLAGGAQFVKFDPADPTHVEGDFIVDKPKLFEDFKRSGGVLCSRIKFYRGFEKYFDLPPAVQVRGDFGARVWAYRGIKQMD